MGTDILRPPPFQILTTRLLLRAARAEDAVTVFEESTGDIYASRFLPRGPHPSQSRTEAVINAWGESNWIDTDRFVWTIIDHSTNKPVGLFLMFMEGEDEAEIHYGLAPAVWGKGLATEAGLGVMRWVDQQSHLSKVHTTGAASHYASCRVLEKIGFVRDQFIAGALLMKATNERLDGWSYIWRRME